jgi:uncharacterized damage-inducible protein DinB
MKRAELLEKVRGGHEKLTAALAGVSDDEATRPSLNQDWSIKDALAHITAWEIEGARVIAETQAGTYQPQKLNKEAIDSFNREATGSRRERSMAEVRAEFDAAHAAMERVLDTLLEEVDESSPAYKFAEGVTFRHHAHHAAQIEEWKKKLSDR